MRHDAGMHDAWPFFALALETPRLVLRVPRDEDLVELGRLAAAGVHPPDEMPFFVPWTDAPADELPRRVLQYHWGQRAALAPAAWTLDLAVLADGAIVGSQGISARDFAVSRTVSTGSWLGRASQGRGIGTEMRAAILHLAFHGLHALRAESAALDGNARSAGVSRRLGYVADGEEILVVRGKRRVATRLVVTPERFAAVSGLPPVAIRGLAPCLPLLGA
jgi:RimJ/RimL family protein N-acetyltransferase